MKSPKEVCMEASGECQVMMRKSESCSALDPKTLELVAIGVSIGSGCDE